MNEEKVPKKLLISSIISRLSCPDKSLIDLVKKALLLLSHLSNNKKDKSSKRSLQRVEGKISRREKWLLRTKTIVSSIYEESRRGLLKVLE